MFITFEGLDFTGKSTQARLLNEYLQSVNKKSILLREPGGTIISEKIRKIILDRDHTEMIPLSEFLLFSASRSQLVSEVIRPNLDSGNVVICDRYYDSSTAYQSYGGSLELSSVLKVNEIATDSLEPDLTFFIDLSPEAAFSRAEKRGKDRDRMENKDLEFYQRVYAGFKDIATKNAKRFVIINGSLTIQEIQLEIKDIINKKLNL